MEIPLNGINNLKILKTIALIGYCIILANSGHAQDAPSYCTGDSYLLAMIDSGGNAQSPCTVYAKKMVGEFDYYYQNFHKQRGYFNSYPDALLRLGLDNRTEINLTVPSFYYSSQPPTHGNSATILGGKRELFYDKNQLFSMAATLGFPDGSSDFGNAHYSGGFAMLYGAKLNSSFYLNLALNYIRVSETRELGGNLFNTFLGRATLSYFPTYHFGVYAEVYSRNKTAFQQGFGTNGDVGALYLIKSNIVVSMAVGQRLAGELDAINQYITLGVALAF